MAQAGRRLGLALGARGGFPFARHDLERDVELRLLVAGEPDRAGAAAAERLEGPVAAEHELGEGERLGGLDHALRRLATAPDSPASSATGVRLHRLNTFDDDNEVGLFDEPHRRPPRDRARRPQRNGPRRPGPPASNSVLRLAGLVALGIAIVLLFVLWVGSCSGQSKGDYSSYIAAMQPLALDSASVGAKFATALGTPGLTMQTFQSDLIGWSRQEQADYVAAQRLQPPGPLQSAHAEALAAFQLRAVGLAGLANTLTLAKAKHDSAPAAAAALVSDAQLLSASDVLWVQLYKLPATQILMAQNVGNVVVPASQIVTSSDIVSAASLATVYQRVGTPSSGGHVTGVHGSALIGTNAVENGISTPLSTSSGTTVAVGSSLVIDVVFKDSGNYPEVKIPVTLTVKAAGKNVYTATQTVAQIATGARATVSFTNLQVPPSAFGHSAFISVSITKVKGEARLDNNAATYPVFFRLAPS